MIPLLLLIAVGGLMHAARSFSTDASLAGTELAFGYLLLAAYFTGKIVNRFGLPKLTGYLAAGVISGQFVMGLVTKDMAVSPSTAPLRKDASTSDAEAEAGWQEFWAVPVAEPQVRDAGAPGAAASESATPTYVASPDKAAPPGLYRLRTTD